MLVLGTFNTRAETVQGPDANLVTLRASNNKEYFTKSVMVS